MSPMIATGGQNAPAAFLAADRSTATLPPIAASAMPSQVVGQRHERHAAQVERSRGADEVGRRAAADGDPRVAALGAHGSGRLPGGASAVRRRLCALAGADEQAPLCRERGQEVGKGRGRAGIRDDDGDAVAGLTDDRTQGFGVEVASEHDSRAGAVPWDGRAGPRHRTADAGAWRSARRVQGGPRAHHASATASGASDASTRASAAR